MEATLAPRIRQKPNRLNIPNCLVYEVLDGQPIYFQGYKDVLNRKKTKEIVLADFFRENGIKIA